MNRQGVIAFTIVVLVTLTLAAGVSGAPTRSSGTLRLDATIVQTWRVGREFCAPATPEAADCLRAVGEASVPGLGLVTVTIEKFLPGATDPSCFMVQNNTAVMEVAGKGTLVLSRPARICASGPPPRQDGPYEFTVASGTGRYAGASGSLVERTSVGAAARGCLCGKARTTWTGSITVPGVDFDLTPPVLSGAVSKTVRVPKKVKRVRVRYTVKAQDAVDGALAVACKPRSGSFFPVGRTRVACSAIDSSGNSAAAGFTVTVRRPR